MTNIIERLRSPEVFLSTSGMVSPVAHQAASEIERLRAENARLREALEDLLDDSEVHDFGEWFENRLKQARAALDPHVQKERRAKALSELAEMDADLLDIDPEVKP